MTEFNIKKPPIPPVFKWIRAINKIDNDLFLKDLHAMPWEDVNEQDNIDDMVKVFNYLLNLIFDEHAPLQKVKIKESPSPWITDNIKLMMSLRDKALHRANRTQKESHFAYYKNMKNMVTSALRREKEAFFSHYVNKNKHKPQQMWNYLKKTSVLNNSTLPDIPPNLNNPDDINNFFLDVPGDSNIDENLLNYYKHNRFGSDDFNLHNTNMDEVSKIIRAITTNAAGWDTVTAEMLRMTLPVTLPIITRIINVSINDKIFPGDWKVAKIKPLPKSSSVKQLNDLRAISILPVMSKIIERVVCTQLTKFLENSTILPAIQSGFRAQHGTATALAEVTDNIIASADVGDGSILVLLDFSRAFDCISAELLLAKMSYYGISHAARDWFSSFLRNRTQFVVTEDGKGELKKSQQKIIPRGCPQGSILSPLLFILYTTDLIKNIKHCKIHLYADDTQVYYSFKHQKTLEAVQLINEDLGKIYEWTKKNALVLNPKKSKYLVLGTKRQCEQIIKYAPDLKINGIMIERVNHAKNLGLLMDSELRFEEHISQKIRTAFFRLKVLYGIRSYLTEEVRIMLTEALILSIFNYCDVVYGPRLLEKTSRAIQRVQNACARFCFTIPKRSHITPYLNNKKIIKMQGRRELHLAGLVYKVVRNKKPEYLYNKIEWQGESHGIHTRSKARKMISCPKHKTKNYKGSFKYASSKIWNNIPPPIQTAMTYLSFKNNMKKYILDKQISLANITYNFEKKLN